MTAATRTIEATAIEPTLYVAFELGETSWKLAFTTGMGQRPRLRTVAARDRAAVQREIAQARARFGLPDTCAVRSCCEPGREGFWLHRWLTAEGVDNRIVDASSIGGKDVPGLLQSMNPHRTATGLTGASPARSDAAPPAAPGAGRRAASGARRDLDHFLAMNLRAGLSLLVYTVVTEIGRHMGERALRQRFFSRGPAAR